MELKILLSRSTIFSPPAIIVLIVI